MSTAHNEDYRILIRSVSEQFEHTEPLPAEETDKIELMTYGSFLKKAGSYYISYKETETIGFAGCTTTIKIAEDGTVDFATFNGYRRYTSNCMVCHGPDGEGSTYAPALKNSVLRLDYYQFQQIVASGKKQVNTAQNQVMPAFGTNKNVWCYVDDIWAYLVARGTDELPRGRPAKKGPKSEAFTAQEDSCMSM